MTFVEILSAYYVFGYDGLELQIIEADDLVNDTDWHSSSYGGLAYIFNTNDIDNTMLTHQHSKQIGIGCACNTGVQGSHICVIATVDDAPIRDLHERIPIDQMAVGQDEQCEDRCTWFGDTGWQDAFNTNATYCSDNSMYVDVSGFC